MPNKKISEFPVTTTLAGSDIFLINHLNTTSTISFSSLSAAISTDIFKTDDFSKFIEKPASPLSGQVLTYDGSTSTWVASSGNSNENLNTNNIAGPVKFLSTQKNTDISFIMAVLKNNKVIGFGRVDRSQNGFYGIGKAYSPQQQVPIIFWTDDDKDYFDTSTAKIIDIQSHRFTSMALLDDGTVWLNGQNTNGWLGVSIPAGAYTCGFKKVNFSDGALIRSICLNADNGGNQECFAAVSTTDNLYLWGTNGEGQLNTGNTNSQTTPVKVTTTGIVNNVSKAYISGSELSNTIVITKDGNVYMCGYNASGQFGVGDKLQKKSFVQSKINSTTFITNVVDAAISPWGTQFYIHLIKSDGTVWAAGGNNHGQLGIGSTTEKLYFNQCTGLTNIIKIEGASNSSYSPSMIALDSSGGVWTWGQNNVGQLGVNDTTKRLIPTKINDNGATDIVAYSGFNTNASTGFIKNKIFYASGANVSTKRGDDGSLIHLPVMLIKNVKQAIFFTAGEDNPHGSAYGILLLTEDGSLYGQGYGRFSILGDSDPRVSSPIRLL